MGFDHGQCAKPFAEVISGHRFDGGQDAGVISDDDAAEHFAGLVEFPFVDERASPLDQQRRVRESLGLLRERSRTGVMKQSAFVIALIEIDRRENHLEAHLAPEVSDFTRYGHPFVDIQARAEIVGLSVGGDVRKAIERATENVRIFGATGELARVLITLDRIDGNVFLKLEASAANAATAVIPSTREDLWIAELFGDGQTFCTQPVRATGIFGLYRVRRRSQSKSFSAAIANVTRHAQCHRRRSLGLEPLSGVEMQEAARVQRTRKPFGQTFRVVAEQTLAFFDLGLKEKIRILLVEIANLCNEPALALSRKRESQRHDVDCGPFAGTEGIALRQCGVGAKRGLVAFRVDG
ncbi:MAG TPA: hypothetical protein VF787_00535 [Thermoanaerobaculia bacterium]